MAVEFAKVDDEKRQVFGWASVALAKDGSEVVDSQGDVIDPETLEKAAYGFALHYRAANEMHAGPTIGRMIESVVITPDKLAKMGLPADAPTGWWIGFQVESDEVWAGVKSGKYRAFSIEGKGKRVPA